MIRMPHLHFRSIMPARRLVRSIIDFCYPGRCANCESACDGSALLCDPCELRTAALEQKPACGKCAMPLPYADAPCARCEASRGSPFARIARLGNYDEPLRSLIHRMKYHRRWTIGEMLAQRLARLPVASELLDSAQVLVPVPLHWRRQVSRGFNQADVIARELRGRRRLEIAHPVARVRNTATQTQLHSTLRRQENMRDAFALIDGKSVHGRRVVLVDDVMTSGATLRAAARALAKAKPASVSAIVLAVADPKSRGFDTV